MKKYFYTALIIIPLLFSACSDSDNTTEPTVTTTDISLSIDPYVLGENHTIIYSIELTGDGALTELTYLDENGTVQTVAKPAATWSKTVSIPKEKSVAMTAKGTITKGSAAIYIKGNNGSSTFQLSDSRTINN